MNYQLVIQFPLTGASADYFDRILMIENELNLALRDKHQVNGHDIGAGKINIFINTNNPDEAFELVRSILSEKDLKNISAAFRDMEGDDFSVIWPENYNAEFKIT
ncbi:MAG: hypothetical protein ACN4GM_04960 [Gammaproteobacteria bacterium]